ncbi:hypothetical protein TVAG_170170 [Trichomonas vaginalis G3]|uniref:Uncharacterized protein n=1 Tax=Trichomonas vaginalis (strain ATCC PRA-98 / G3) TaxID=412133 RepID=A2DPG0_TRIV3|nr:WD40 repeat-like family [Trichomonas vaginalis G3]EAY17704.1 hypothetical protein TVAG_170170 [Trichomonas vaginalis G3]KAI5507891.1 WD40 repeat-like family [Trichomonas vaginalis G3]|eukprot:XP_001329839.1 hypothetical protein [Trichomonas vaginalis G3]
MRKVDLNYGTAPIFEINIGSGGVNSVHTISENLYLSTSSDQISLFDSDTVQESVPTQTECSVYIRKQELLVAITKSDHSFIILTPSNLKMPFLEGIPTNQSFVNHIIYSSKSNIFLTIGQGVSIWRFSFDPTASKGNLQKAGFKITLQGHFLDDYNFTILNEPQFDYHNEFLILPSQSGIRFYKQDGSYSQFTTDPISEVSPISFNQSISKLLAINEDKITIYHKNQSIFRCFKLPNESIISAFYFSKTDVLFVTAKQDFFLMNLKTGKFWRCASARQPISRLLYYPGSFPRIIRITGSTIYCRQINIPWKFWVQNIGGFKQIQRNPKINSAARLTMLTDDNTITFISPKNKAVLTSLPPSNQTKIIQIFYDRGFSQKNTKRDDLMVITEDGKLSVYNTETVPISLKSDYEFNATYLTQFTSKGDPFYAISTTTGEILICNYEDLKISNRIQISPTPEPIKCVEFDGQHLIAITESELIAYNATTLSFVLKKKCNTDGLIKMNNNILYIGRDNGKISRYEIINQNIRETMISSHESEITSFSFGDAFWVSISLDGTVNYHNYVDTCLANINLDNQIFSSEILNGKRDLILSTPSDLMIIKGPIVFGKECDQEIPQLDNYNRIVDVLASGMFRSTSLGDVEPKEAIFIRNERLEKQITEENLKYSAKSSPKPQKTAEMEEDNKDQENNAYDNDAEVEEEKNEESNHEIIIQEPEAVSENAESREIRAPRHINKEDIKQKGKDKKSTNSKRLNKNKNTNSYAGPVQSSNSLKSLQKNEEILLFSQDCIDKLNKKPQKHQVSQPHGKNSNPKSIQRIKDRISDQKFQSQKEITIETDSYINIPIEKSNSLTSFDSILTPPPAFGNNPNSAAFKQNFQKASVANVYANKKKANTFAYNERSLFQPLNLPNQNKEKFIDPQLYPDDYRKQFFELDKGYSMNKKSFQTILPPSPNSQPETSSNTENSANKENKDVETTSKTNNKEEIKQDDSMINYVIMKRYPTPPVIKEEWTVNPPRHRLSRNETPNFVRPSIILQNEVTSKSEVNKLYGKGSHALIPLPDRNDSDSLNNKQNKVKYNSQNQKNSYRESLIIQPIHFLQPGEAPPPPQTANQRARIIVPAWARSARK